MSGAKALVRRLLHFLKGHRVSLLAVYAVIELRAYIRHRTLTLRLAGSRTPISSTFPRLAWRRFFASRLSIEAKKRPADMRVFVERLFWNRPAVEVTRPSVEKWLRTFLTCFEDEERPWQWSRGACGTGQMKDDTREEQAAAEQELKAEAEQLRGVLEDSFGCRFPDGPQQDFIRINSPVSNHTPATSLFPLLPLRLGKTFLRRAAHGIFRQLGFKWHRDEATGMEFWFRGGHGPGLLFLHGVGFGLAPYAAVIWELAYRFKGPLLLGDLPILGGSEPRSVGTPWPRAEEIAHAIERVKEMHSIRTLHGCAHSLGGCVMSSVKQIKPDLFTRVAYVESPVVFFRATDGWPYIFHRHSITSFFVRAYRCEFVDLMGDIFLCDPWQQHVINHGVWWMEFCGMEQDLNENVFFILGEKDRLVCGGIKEWLAAEYPKVQVATHGGEHGGIALPQNVQWFVEKLMRFYGRKDEERAPSGLSKSESASRLAAGLVSSCLPLMRSESRGQLMRSESGASLSRLRSESGVSLSQAGR